MGVNNHIPLVFRFAPKYLQGLELPDLYTEQGIAQINHFLKHIGEQTQDASMIICTLEAAQLQIGTSVSFLKLPFQDYEYLLPKCWVKSLWEFTSRHGIIISGPMQTPKLSRRQGANIIEEIVKNHPNLNKEELRIFNNCQIHLQVYCLSDIATGDGKRITDNALRGRRDRDRVSKLTWPNQPRPAEKYWKTWRKLLRQIFTRGSYWSLARTLGSWIETHHQTHKWFYCDENSTVYYKQNETQFRVYTRLEGHRLRTSTKYRFSDVTENLPPYFEFTTIRRTIEGDIRSEGSAPYVKDNPTVYNTFNYFVQSQPKWKRDMFQNKD